MKLRPLLSPLAFKEHSIESFWDYCSSLVIHPPSKASKTVPDLTISWTKKSVIVRFKRTPKEIKEAEVEALAVEYAKEKEEIWKILTDRKIPILNSEGKQANEWTTSKTRKRSSKKQKGNALADSERGKADLESELLKP